MAEWKPTHSDCCNDAEESPDPISSMLRGATNRLDADDALGAKVLLHGARLAWAHEHLTAAPSPSPADDLREKVARAIDRNAFMSETEHTALVMPAMVILHAKQGGNSAEDRAVAVGRLRRAGTLQRREAALGKADEILALLHQQPGK